MTVAEQEVHSPLGASGAYRWMPPPYGGGCYGSVQLSRGVHDEESEYAALGTAAHALAAICLQEGNDAWELTGISMSPPAQEPSELIAVDKDMADAVQVYLDAVRAEHPDRDQGNTWVERRFHCPEIHELFYGTADLVHLEPVTHGDVIRLHVWDYKHGAGIIVWPQKNPQLMYYGVGALTELGLWDVVDEVVLRIAQPRGYADPIREWTVSTKELARWRDEDLVPAMDKALVSRETASGDHCRFCPARSRGCPQIVADMQEMEELMKDVEAAGGAAELSNEQVARFLTLSETAKIVAKAARETGFQRAQKGVEIPGWKLVAGRANRTFKDGAEAAAKKMFKTSAYTKPALKSPAQIEMLPRGKAFTTEWAYKPEAGLQLVPASDARKEAGPSVKSMFKPVAGKKKGAKK